MGRFKTIQMRIDANKDFKMRRKDVVVRNHRVVPDSIVEVTEEFIDEETGEVTETVTEAKCTITRDKIEDARGFVKHFRFRGMMGLSGQTLKLYCYMLETMDQFGHVETNWFDIEEYVGTGVIQQLTPAFRKLIDKSLIVRRTLKHPGYGHKWGHYTVQAASKKKVMQEDMKKGRFVKIYNPAVISALSKGGLMLLCYIMDTCGYDGLVNLKCNDFLKYTQDWLGKDGLKTAKSFYDARADLMSEKINILKPLYDLVEDRNGEVTFDSIKGWYRISPNVCFVGNRSEAGYTVGEEY